MRNNVMRAAGFIAALLLPVMPVVAQDVTLVSRDGSLSLTGTLQTFDGEFYRVVTNYGALTVDAQGVLCEGPGCPDLIAPQAVIRLMGAPDAGAALIPPLFAAFAALRGLDYRLTDPSTPGATFTAQISDPLTRATLAEVSFQPSPPSEARAALAAGQADLVISAGIETDFGTRTLASEALVAITAPDNPLPRISSVALAHALQGDIDNWAQIGGPDMPLILHTLAPDSDLQEALVQRLGRLATDTVIHADLRSLAQAVARDPWALAVTGEAEAGPAKTLTLTDSCGFELSPSRLAVKADDYPLALPLHLLTPRRRLPLMAREFLEFLTTPQAQAAVAGAGYIDRSPERLPLTGDGLRLIHAIRGADQDTTIDDLKHLVALMDGADRLSLTFRFDDGSAGLDAASRQNVADLADLLGADLFHGQQLILAGFSDGSGQAQANLDLSLARAEAVRAALSKSAPDLDPTLLPQVEGLGEILPMACDTTAPGRRLNRRVELWVKPEIPVEDPAQVQAADPAAVTDTLQP